MLRLRHLLFAPIVLVLAACSSDSTDGETADLPPFSGLPGPANEMPAPAPTDTRPAGSNAVGTPGEVVPDMLAAGGSSAQLPTSTDPTTPGAGGSAGAEDPGTAQGGTAATEEPPASGSPSGPSAGCGIQNPPTGAGSLTIRGAQADYVITLPNGYDANTPTPLIFAFHGRNRTHVQLQTIDAANIQTELGGRAIMAYMKSQGGPGWNFAEEVPPSIEFFEAMFPRMLDTYCVDTARVFAVGHSSGAYFADILACRYGNRLRGVGDVSGALQETTCAGQPVAGMFVHGVRDTVVPNSGGRAVRDQFIALNGCQQSTQPGAVSPCVAYDGCQAGFPVQWCEHEEPTYSDTNGPTNHGWPSFASRAIGQFLFSLP
jgi:polyhydroxybutyrate depolymerase